MHQDNLQSYQKSTLCSKNVERADQTNSTAEASPTNYGWKLTQNCLQPDWYPGSSVPESLTCASTTEDSMEATSTDDEESENACSDDSYENDEEV